MGAKRAVITLITGEELVSIESVGREASLRDQGIWMTDPILRDTEGREHGLAGNVLVPYPAVKMYQRYTEPGG